MVLLTEELIFISFFTVKLIVIRTKLLLLYPIIYTNNLVLRFDMFQKNYSTKND